MRFKGRKFFGGKTLHLSRAEQSPHEVLLCLSARLHRTCFVSAATDRRTGEQKWRENSDSSACFGLAKPGRTNEVNDSNEAAKKLWREERILYQAVPKLLLHFSQSVDDDHRFPPSGAFAHTQKDSLPPHLTQCVQKPIEFSLMNRN